MRFNLAPTLLFARFDHVAVMAKFWQRTPSSMRQQNESASKDPLLILRGFVTPVYTGFDYACHIWKYEFN